MCSPELVRGICQICTGTLTPETTHVDRDGNQWDVHRGVCAMHAGEIPAEHVPEYTVYIRRIKAASTQNVRQAIIKSLHGWIERVADENHYRTDGPAGEEKLSE